MIDPALEFLEGFFQKGRTMMYVSRGIGTSFLPFRLGVKPEVTFFQYGKGTRNLDSFDQSTILNNPPKTIFTGIGLGALWETFNIFKYLNLFSDNADLNPSNVLFDFESDSDLKRLNWECHKWFDLTENHATSGRYSLKVMLPPGRYPGINFQKIKGDWSEGKVFKMDAFNPAEEALPFHIRIDDHKSGWKYANRFDFNVELRPGMNHLSIPTQSIKTNIHHRFLNLNKIKRLMVFMPNNTKEREIYIDTIRLE